MNYLLDTNACIALINESPIKVRQSLELAIRSGGQIFLSTVVIHELWFGVWKSEQQTRNSRILRSFLQKGFTILMFSSTDAESAGEIRAGLRRTGTPIGAYDTLIAGQVLARGLTLVTANTREFSRVTGLKLVDWS